MDQELENEGQLETVTTYIYIHTGETILFCKKYDGGWVSNDVRAR